jgi:hypothetical protein
MKIKKEEVEKIIELSKILRNRDVALKYGVTTACIDRILRVNGIKNERTRLNLSRLSFDFNYFDEIDNEKKAYWLGFIAADGCLKNNKLTLTSKDEEIIDKFKNDLKSEHKKSKNVVFDKRTKKIYINYTIQITSAAFVKKLYKYIPHDKSSNFIIPEIEKKYLSLFLSGLLDGDGTFSYDGKKLRIGFISTKECLLQIQEFLINKFGLNKTKMYHMANNVWRVHLYAGSFEILKFIYNDSFKEIYLTRKYNKYKKILNEINK